MEVAAYIGFRVKGFRGFPKLGLGSPKKGLQYFGVYTGSPLFWETTI